MYIGKLSEITGATPKAIRHYEAIGLIPPPERKGEYRFYSNDYIRIIQVVKQAQKLGFKLSELEGIVKRMSLNDDFPYAEILSEIERKREKIRFEILQLTELDKGLLELKNKIEFSGCSC